MAKTTANAVADYIIRFCHQHGDLITNLHLQKLVYYIQAWHLAYYDEPLFDEDFQAWASGPVQPELFERFLPYEWNPINEKPNVVEFSKEIEDHILEVLQEYGQHNSFRLEIMTHEEDPWRKAHRGYPTDEDTTNIISKKSMRKYYQRVLEDEEEEAEERRTSQQSRNDLLETTK